MLSLILFLFTIAIQAEDLSVIPQEEISETPALNLLTEAEIKALLSEEPYIGETGLLGNKDWSKKFMSVKIMNKRN